MKIGFWLNIMFVLVFIFTQMLIWVLDGTIVKQFAQLLNKKPSTFEKEHLKELMN